MRTVDKVNQTSYLYHRLAEPFSPLWAGRTMPASDAFVRNSPSLRFGSRNFTLGRIGTGMMLFLAVLANGHAIVRMNELGSQPRETVPLVRTIAPYDTEIRSMLARVARATVTVERVRGDESSKNGPRESQDGGSGWWVMDHKGCAYILTNFHVIDGSDNNRIWLYDGRDGSDLPPLDVNPFETPNGVSVSKDHDLAVLRVNDTCFVLPYWIDPLRFRDLAVEPLRLGERVYVLGAPLMYRDNVTTGIISHIERKESMEPLNIFIQTDATINPGNSGGLMIDSQGRIIGVPTLKVMLSDGLGFAIRNDVVKQTVAQFIELNPTP